MRAIHGFMGLLGALWIGLLAVHGVDAQAPNITLSVIPKTLKIAPGGTAKAIVMANIPSTITVHSVELSAFADDGVKVTIEKGELNQPPLKDQVAWTALIAGSKKEVPVPDGEIYFRALFQIQWGNGQVVPWVTTEPLKIEQRLPNPVDKVVKVDFQTALETLLDGQCRQVFLVVRNISHMPVTVTDIKVCSIPCVTTIVSNGPGSRLKPQQSHPFPITLNANSTVKPGKHLLVVQVDVEWEQNGQCTTGGLVLNRDLQVGVFGESAILQATTIPSVMLLPGCLLLTFFLFLVRRTFGSTPIDLDFKKPEFWAISITISLVAIAFYPGHLESYGFRDILYLWCGAVLLGILAWVVVLMIGYVLKGIAAYYVWKERHRRAVSVPTSNDPPLLILRKIAYNQENHVDLPEVTYPAGDSNPQRVYKLPSAFPEPGKIWVCPRIRVRWRKGDNTSRLDLDRLIDNKQAVREVIDRLEEWQNPAEDPTVELDWSPRGPHVTGPQQVEEHQSKEADSSGDPFIWHE